MNCKMVLRRQLFDQVYQQQRRASMGPSEEQTSDKMDIEEMPGESQRSEEVQPKQEEKSCGQHYMMFLTDKVPSFYRRLHSSMDGLFTVIPCCRLRLFLQSYLE